jgi:hypothetical protein
MLKHMNRRTTLIMNASIHEALRARAAREGRTFTEVLEWAVRQGLAARGPSRRTRMRLPSFDLGPFLADPADPSALAALGSGLDSRP